MYLAAVPLSSLTVITSVSGPRTLAWLVTQPCFRFSFSSVFTPGQIILPRVRLSSPSSVISHCHLRRHPPQLLTLYPVPNFQDEMGKKHQLPLESCRAQHRQPVRAGAAVGLPDRLQVPRTVLGGDTVITSSGMVVTL